MGTRADFYIDRGPELEWLGSLGCDGDPLSLRSDDYNGGAYGVGGARIFLAGADDWEDVCRAHIVSRDDGILAGDGWPWPWRASTLTDWSYIFRTTRRPDDAALSPWGMLDAYEYGEPWHDMAPEQAWPDMRSASVAGARSRAGMLRALTASSPRFTLS